MQIFSWFPKGDGGGGCPEGGCGDDGGGEGGNEGGDGVGDNYCYHHHHLLVQVYLSIYWAYFWDNCRISVVWVPFSRVH